MVKLTTVFTIQTHQSVVKVCIPVSIEAPHADDHSSYLYYRKEISVNV